MTAKKHQLSFLVSFGAPIKEDVNALKVFQSMIPKLFDNYSGISVSSYDFDYINGNAYAQFMFEFNEDKNND